MSCSRCGACCRNVDLVPEELREGVVAPRKDGSCVHLMEGNLCDVYESRPKVCRVEEWTNTTDEKCDMLHSVVYGTQRTR